MIIWIYGCRCIFGAIYNQIYWVINECKELNINTINKSNIDVLLKKKWMDLKIDVSIDEWIDEIVDGFKEIFKWKN